MGKENNIEARHRDFEELDMFGTTEEDLKKIMTGEERKEMKEYLKSKS